MAPIFSQRLLKTILVSALLTIPVGAQLEGGQTTCIKLSPDAPINGCYSRNAYLARSSNGQFTDKLLYGGSPTVVRSVAQDGAIFGEVRIQCPNGVSVPNVAGTAIQAAAQNILNICPDVCGVTVLPSGCQVIVAVGGSTDPSFAQIVPTGRCCVTPPTNTDVLSLIENVLTQYQGWHNRVTEWYYSLNDDPASLARRKVTRQADGDSIELQNLQRDGNNLRQRFSTTHSVVDSTEGIDSDVQSNFEDSEEEFLAENAMIQSASDAGPPGSPARVQAKALAKRLLAIAEANLGLLANAFFVLFGIIAATSGGSPPTTTVSGLPTTTTTIAPTSTPTGTSEEYIVLLSEQSSLHDYSQLKISLARAGCAILEKVIDDKIQYYSFVVDIYPTCLTILTTNPRVEAMTKDFPDNSDEDPPEFAVSDDEAPSPLPRNMTAPELQAAQVHVRAGDNVHFVAPNNARFLVPARQNGLGFHLGWINSVFWKFNLGGTNAIEARDYFWDTTLGPRTTPVYLVDTGIHGVHSEFNNLQFTQGWDFTRVSEQGLAAALTDTGGRTTPPGHGTSMAGAIGGFATGVDKQANIISMKAISPISRMRMMKKLLAERKAANGAFSIVTLSFATPRDVLDRLEEQNGKTADMMVRYLARLERLNTLVVTGADNNPKINIDDTSPQYLVGGPNSKHVLVAACDVNGAISTFAAHTDGMGVPRIDLHMIGQEVLTPAAGTPNRYKNTRGSSVAAALTSGLLSLLKATNAYQGFNDAKTVLQQIASDRKGMNWPLPANGPQYFIPRAASNQELDCAPGVARNPAQPLIAALSSGTTTTVQFSTYDINVYRALGSATCLALATRNRPQPPLTVSRVAGFAGAALSAESVATDVASRPEPVATTHVTGKSKSAEASTTAPEMTAAPSLANRAL